MNHSLMRRAVAAGVTLYALLSLAPPANMMQTAPVDFDKLFAADAIILAEPVVAATPSHGPNAGQASATVKEFKVLEVVKGRDLGQTLNVIACPSAPVSDQQGARYLLFLVSRGDRLGYDCAQGEEGVRVIDKGNEHLVRWGRVRVEACQFLRREHRHVVSLPEPEAREMFVQLFRNRTGSPDQDEAYAQSRCYLQRFGQSPDDVTKYIRKFSDKYEQATWTWRIGATHNKGMNRTRHQMASHPSQPVLAGYARR